MGTIAEVTLPADQFALADALAARPDAEFETVRAVSHGHEGVMPFLWASGCDADALHRAVEADGSTRSVREVARLDGESLCRVEWADDVAETCGLLVEAEGSILDAVATRDAWSFRVLFREHDAVAATHDRCTTRDLDLEFQRIYDVGDSFRRGRFGLTESQYETICTAYERGYYAVPRGITLADLAGDLDVSHQALSERLRRGHGTLVERALRPELAQSVQ